MLNSRIDPFTEMRLQRGAQHLVRLGARATAEYIAELSRRIGGMPAAIELLGEFEARLTPEMLRAVGGDRFPRRLQAIPR